LIWSSSRALVSGLAQSINLTDWPSGVLTLVWRDAAGRSGGQRFVRLSAE
jgi:hypothetical protein